MKNLVKFKFALGKLINIRFKFLHQKLCFYLQTLLYCLLPLIGFIQLKVCNLVLSTLQTFT